jgi:hypothetical protein
MSDGSYAVEVNRYILSIHGLSVVHEFLTRHKLSARYPVASLDAHERHYIELERES